MIKDVNFFYKHKYILMNKNILWNTVKIQVPSDFISISKTGVVRIKPPLTKTNKVATVNKKPAIEFETANVNDVKVIQTGKKETVHELKSKSKKTKENEKIETNTMGNEDINRAESETERNKRKKKKDFIYPHMVDHRNQKKLNQNHKLKEKLRILSAES